MKEGLRSGVLKDDEVSLEKGDDENMDSHDLGNQGNGFEGEVMSLSDLDVDKLNTESSPQKSTEIKSKSENGNKSRRGRKSRRVANGDDGGNDVEGKKLEEEDVDSSDDDSVERKKVKGELTDGSGGDGVERKRVKDAVVSGKVGVVGRVLRSGSVAVRDEENENNGCEVHVDVVQNGSVRGRKRKRRNNESAKEIVMTEKVEATGSVSMVRRKLKRKRGRPPKKKGKSAASKEEKMAGLNERKRGRPPKLIDSVKNKPLDNSCSEKKCIGKELKSKRISYSRKNKSADSETEHNEFSSSAKPKRADASSENNRSDKVVKIQRTKKLTGNSKFTEKQLLRKQITDMLLGSGWTIDYRPRKGREYNDAVYKCPGGGSYWSITLAYRILKRKVENGEVDSTNGSTSSAFTAIPEEIMNKLTKQTKQRKVRDLKLKLKTEGGSNPDEADVDKKSATKKHRAEKLGSNLSKRRMKGKKSYNEQDISADTSNCRMTIPVRRHKSQKSQNRKRCALLVRSSTDSQDIGSDGYVPFPWKRTVLAWMIDLGIVPLNGKVQYMNRRKTRVVLEGRITKDGIHCSCCDEIVSISKFESHSGSRLSEPLHNICLESGTTLLQCQLDSLKKTECERFYHIDVDGDDPNDDTCGICGDGGDLICCDSCPSTFHQSCLNIQTFPSGDWHCVYCLCKFCGMVGGNSSEGDDNHNSPLFTCLLCEEKYHQSCIQAKDAQTDDSGASSFCGKNCQELFERLQMLLGVEHELEEGFYWALVKHSDCGSDLSVRGMLQKVVSNSRLAVALSVMDECFLPVVDHRSGINLIHNILYNCGSNFNRINYSGFITAILGRGDEIISAASIRIHGNQLAEMPFIGTRHMYRRQGMCSRLLRAIESALSSLNIEKLVIPAISELRQTWTSVFGFNPLEVSKKQEMRNMNMIVFPGTDMLQKPLLEHKFSDNIEPTSDLRPAELDTNISNDGMASHAHGINDEAAVVKIDSEIPDGSLNDASDLTSDTINLGDSAGDTKWPIQSNMTHDTLNEPKTSVINIEASASKTLEENKHDTPKEICENNYIVPAPNERTIEQESETNQHANCEKSESLEVSQNAFKSGTKTASAEVKREVGIADVGAFSPDEKSVYSADIGVTQSQKLAKQELRVSCENIVSNDSEATNHTSLGAKHLDSQPLPVQGCVSDADVEVIDPQLKCNFSSDVITHPTFPSNDERPQHVSSYDSCAPLVDDCNLNSSSHGDGLDHHKQVDTASVITNSHPLCEPTGVTAELNLQTSCILSCPDVVNHHTAPEVVTMGDGDSPKVAPSASQTDSYSFDEDIPFDRPPKQSDSESQVDHSSTTQCNPESLCNLSSASGVTLLCAQGGCNATNTPEVMVLSNQAG